MAELQLAASARQLSPREAWLAAEASLLLT
jgi:hypothetical protein